MTDITLVTTTINVPHRLQEVREIAPNIEIIIAGDVKTPWQDIELFCTEIGAHYLSLEEQNNLGYEVSEVIGWNSIQRRNIAILEAIRSNPDIIYTWDDDNDLFENHFETLEALLTKPNDFEMLRHESGWINPGMYADPPHTKRGFPYSEKIKRQGMGINALPLGGRAEGAQIAISEGLITSNPDVNATERIEGCDYAFSYDINNERFTKGFGINPKSSWAPINSQNTAYRREVFPLLFVLPGVGRYDDIWAGCIAQRVLMETNYFVHFGEPIARQERNEHDLIRDLMDEMFGIQHTDEFCAMLKSIPLNRDASIFDNLELLTRQIAHWFTVREMHQTARFLRTWVYDVEKAMRSPA